MDNVWLIRPCHVGRTWLFALRVGNGRAIASSESWTLLQLARPHRRTAADFVVESRKEHRQARPILGVSGEALQNKFFQAAAELRAMHPQRSGPTGELTCGPLAQLRKRQSADQH